MNQHTALRKPKRVDPPFLRLSSENNNRAVPLQMCTQYMVKEHMRVRVRVGVCSFSSLQSVCCCCCCTQPRTWIICVPSETLAAAPPVCSSCRGVWPRSVSATRHGRGCADAADTAVNCSQARSGAYGRTPATTLCADSCNIEGEQITFIFSERNRCSSRM